jgi:hypothetical protein
MDTSNKKIIVGGWPIFAEQTGVNKTEPYENFDWMDESSKFDYNDCSYALNRFEGSREWLKNYTSKKHSLSFSCEMGLNISSVMKTAHSGASFASLMWHYQYALNNWDKFVFETKKYKGLREFKHQQIQMWKANILLHECNEWLRAASVEKAQKIQMNILAECEKHSLTGLSVPEIKEVLVVIVADLEAIEAEDRRIQEEEDHRSLMGCLEFLYEVPIRWFDSPSGCSLKPVHPSRITKRAKAEMETKFPGYNDHIRNVLQAMSCSDKPEYYQMSNEKVRNSWEKFLREQEVITTPPVPQVAPSSSVFSCFS